MDLNLKYLRVLCCPKTGMDLILKEEESDKDGSIISGILTTKNEEYTYPIINGIPRFVDKEHYSSSFGYEWKKWSRTQFESENIGKPMEGHTKKMFGMITGFTKKDLNGKLVVEIGCGSGRFLDIVRQYGGFAVGIDMSLAVESARENFKQDPKVLIIQGDISNPPFKPSTFDVGYSIGVLHHTPNPGKNFKNLVKVVKKDGLVSCSVYQKKGFYDYPSIFIYRRIRNALKPFFGNKMALLYANFSAYILYYILLLIRKLPKVGAPLTKIIEKYLLVNLNIPDVRWRVLDVFDAITPVYASTHTSEEVRQWFKDSKCRDIVQTSWGATSFTGKKGAK